MTCSLSASQELRRELCRRQVAYSQLLPSLGKSTELHYPWPAAQHSCTDPQHHLMSSQAGALCQQEIKQCSLPLQGSAHSCTYTSHTSVRTFVLYFAFFFPSQRIKVIFIFTDDRNKLETAGDCGHFEWRQKASGISSCSWDHEFIHTEQ